MTRLRITLFVLGLLLGFLIGCKRVVSTEVTGDAFEDEIVYNCTHTGYCFVCGGLDAKGQAICGFQLSGVCQGTQHARIVRTPVRLKFDDGSVSNEYQTRIISEGTCN